MNFMPTKSINYGTIIRLNREYQQLSIGELSSISGISTSQISKIERGYEAATDEIVGILFTSLKIDFTQFITKFPKIVDKFWDFYQSIVYFDSEEITYQKLEELNKFHKDEITIELTLANTIYYSTFDISINIIEEGLEILDGISDYIDSEYKPLYMDYYGIYFEEINRIDKAIYYFQLALEFSNNRMTSSMIYYHLGAAYRKNLRVLKAYQAIIQAKKLFLEYDNFIRSGMCDIILANIHNTNGEAKEALELYEKSLIGFDRLNVSAQVKSTIYINLIWINILLDQYEEGLDIMRNLDPDIRKCLEKTDSFYLYKLILLYETGKKEEAHKICKSYKLKYNKESITHNFIMYYYFIDGTKTNRLRYLHQIKMIIKKNGLYSNYRLLFKLLKKECTSEKQLQELNDLMYNYIFNSYED